MTRPGSPGQPPVNRLTSAVLSLFAAPRIDMRADYEKVRRAQRALSRTPRDPYRFLDQAVRGEDGHEIPVRLFFPRTLTKPGVLLFFHGGGWVTGDIDTYTSTCLTMADLTGRIVCSVDYRLAPEHPYPAGLQDCLRVTETLLERPYLAGGADPEDITLVGDSAGANLAAAVSLDLHRRGVTLPGAQVLLYPVVQWDHDPRTSPYDSVRAYGTGLRLTALEVRDYMAMYQPDPALRATELVSPLAAEDLTGQPRTLVVTAELDLLRDEGEAYGRALRAAGTPTRIERVDGALHGFIILPRFSRALARAYDHIISFLEGDMADSRPLEATTDGADR
ncbi:Acetyl esterase/lipase [Raineyella antarctica]|uniref:Acetyl esterase/lipase n=1 Tax=Raineyella antarctica TaxID=1577474 RepID=A0A1G6GLD6_9ACTN|nr:alpha/beta hydrolase [Raineyella antarctica]SDB82744.1 Acetyl esterase/lipase [Raineyella antarctica]